MNWYAFKNKTRRALRIWLILGLRLGQAISQELTPSESSTLTQHL
jgi:hypothetical protein